MLAMCEEGRALARQRQTAAEQRTGGAPRGGRAIGVGPPPTPPPHGDVLGLALVVFGVTAMAGLHGEGLPEDAGQALVGTQVSPPVPGEETCDTAEHVLPGGHEGVEKGGWTSGHSAVPQELPLLGQDAEVHGAGMQVDAAVNLVRLRIKSPEVSSALLRESLRSQHTTGVCEGGGLNK